MATPVVSQEFQEKVAFYLAQKALEEMATGLSPGGSKTDKLTGPGKLAESESSSNHVKALAQKIMSDPSFPLLLETARKMAEKHPNALDQDK
ncbi:MAG: hypothetical protein JWM80_4088 [Cyanobacteria bacterium RYN_339]|nr:hypothetical protein [Cyanobacteria bacterium RYN_339]